MKKYIITKKNYSPHYPAIVASGQSVKDVTDYLTQLSPEDAARTQVWKEVSWTYNGPLVKVDD